MNWEQHFRSMNRPDYAAEYYRQQVGFGGFLDDTWHVLTTPIDQQVADYQLAKDNLNAVNDYIHSTPLKTDQAKSLASDWARWWDATGNPDNYSVTIPPPVWDEARNRRIAFDLANATTQAEKDIVVQVATTGMSSEQMQGKEDRRDPNTGLYFVPPPPPPPTFPPWVKPVFIGAVALGVGLSVVPIIRKLVLHV
jgi:hypothetical protein